MRGGLAVAPRPMTPLVAGAPPAVARSARDAAPITWPWKGVTWSISYIALLVYTHVVITYAFPIGDIAVAAALGGLLLLGQPLRLPAPLLIVAALIGVAAASSLTGLYTYVSRQEYLAVVKVWFIALAVVNAIRTREQARFYVIWLLGCFALYPLRGAYFNSFIYRSAVAGRVAWNYIFSNPNDLAAFAMFPLGLCIGLLMTEQQKIIKRCAQAGAVMLPLMIFLTQSRGGVLGLSAFLVGAFATSAGKRLKYLGFAIGASVVIAIFAPSSVWQRLENLTKVTSEDTRSAAGDSGSAEQRYEIWRVAWAVSRENLALGVGLGAYTQAHLSMAAKPQFKPTAWGARDAHSTYLTMLAETGLFGFLLFMAFVTTVIGYGEIWRRRMAPVMPHTARQILFGELGLIAYLTCGIFGSYGRLSLTYLFFFTFYALVDALRRDYLTTHTQPTRGSFA